MRKFKYVFFYDNTELIIYCNALLYDNKYKGLTNCVTDYFHHIGSGLFVWYGSLHGSSRTLAWQAKKERLRSFSAHHHSPFCVLIYFYILDTTARSINEPARPRLWRNTNSWDLYLRLVLRVCVSLVSMVILSIFRYSLGILVGHENAGILIFLWTQPWIQTAVYGERGFELGADFCGRYERISRVSARYLTMTVDLFDHDETYVMLLLWNDDGRLFFAVVWS